LQTTFFFITLCKMAFPSPNVFCTMGHACDLAAEGRFTVPPGCKYVTLEICGRGGWELPKLYAAFRNPTLCIPLMFPERPALLAIFRKYIGHSKASSITVHNEGETYTNSAHTYLTDTPPLVWKSGLYRLGETTLLTNGKMFFDKNTSDDVVNYDDVYKGSLYRPTGGPTPTIRNLMEYQPGIYYNFACRNTCSERDAEFVPHVRRNSHYREIVKNKERNRVFSSNLQSYFNNQTYPPGKEKELGFLDSIGSRTLAWRLLLGEFQKWYAIVEHPAQQYLRMKQLLPDILNMIRDPHYLETLQTNPFGFAILYNYFYEFSVTNKYKDSNNVCDTFDELATHILPPHLRRIRGVTTVHSPTYRTINRNISMTSNNNTKKQSNNTKRQSNTNTIMTSNKNTKKQPKNSKWPFKMHPRR